uniref:Uncharacterized protein n=1 Tax=Rangifer tarandus platyrhynchus TaxID=3082113 RepID=A0ACB0E3Y3_RANTA|nr:unnamed protein product [Rangifer tarandus platyrhynchus]
MRAAPAPPGLAGFVRAHARCPPEASGCAERARAARRRTCEVSLEEREGGCAESAAWGASTPHLEERVLGRKEDEWIKEKKNNPLLRMGLEPGRAPGHRVGKVRVAPGGPAATRAGPGEGSLALGLGEPAWARSAGERGSQMAARARGGGGAATGARPGGGPAGAGPPSRAPLLLEPREGGAKQL